MKARISLKTPAAAVAQIAGFLTVVVAAVTLVFSSALTLMSFAFAFRAVGAALVVVGFLWSSCSEIWISWMLVVISILISSGVLGLNLRIKYLYSKY